MGNGIKATNVMTPICSSACKSRVMSRYLRPVIFLSIEFGVLMAIEGIGRSGIEGGRSGVAHEGDTLAPAVATACLGGHNNSHKGKGKFGRSNPADQSIDRSNQLSKSSTVSKVLPFRNRWIGSAPRASNLRRRDAASSSEQRSKATWNVTRKANKRI